MNHKNMQAVSRLVFSTLIILSMLLSAALFRPASAQAGGGGLPKGNTYHFRYSGLGGDSYWSTCPNGGSPGQTCTDTWIYAAEQMYRDNYSSGSDTSLSVNQATYMIDQNWNYVPLVERWGWGPATVSVTKKLTSGSASGVISMTTCTVDPNWNYTCGDPVDVSVSAVWTGQGELVRSHGNFHSVSKIFTANNHFRGTYRNASATGQINGSSLGVSLYGQLFNSKSSDVSICHGC